MLDHQPDQFAVAEFVFRQPKLFINGLTLTQKIPRLQIHLAKQLGKFLPAEWFYVVIDFLVRNAALTEQLVHLATLRSSRFFVNRDLVRHFLYGKIPLMFVASATLPTASI